ncbi:DoxX family protein [Haliangium sp.]|uniref:DoxX family protein n=1 Tax=Haliangium sp. TaxID=2663208 RepID=UPI003D14B04C
MSELTRTSTSVGLLALRLGVAGMLLVGHGWPKLIDFGAKSHSFPDPLGVGSLASLSLAIVGEVLCPALIAVGLFTRLATVPLLVTMLVAAFLVHGADSWSEKEPALMFALPALTLLFTGAGSFSIDGRRRGR